MSYKSGWLLLRFGKGLVDVSSPVSELQEAWVELYDDRVLVKKSTTATTATTDTTTTTTASSARPSSATSGLDDVRVVKVTKSSTGLDFSIKGGAEHGLPILISRIFENGAAAKTGQLNTGDCILEVNGVNLEGATHEQAVAALKGVDRVAVMKVRFHSQAHARLTNVNNSEDKLKKSIPSAQEKPALTASGDWGKAPTPQESSLTELYSIPLEKMIITRYNKNDGLIENGLVMRAFDHSSAIEFTAHNTQEIESWFSAISKVTAHMYSVVLGSLKKKTIPEPFTGKAKKLGFVSQYYESSWRYYFAVVTDYDLNLFVGVPSHFDNPHKSYPLVDCRLALVDEPSRRVDQKEHAFVLYYSGGSVLYFAAETADDRDIWFRSLQSSSIRSVKMSEDLVFKGVYNNRDVALSLLWEDGIKLSRMSDGAVKGTIWKYKPYQLVSTAHHDKTLVLTFSPSKSEKSEKVIIEQLEVENVRGVLHALYNMLQARVIEAEPLPSEVPERQPLAIQA